MKKRSDGNRWLEPEVLAFVLFLVAASSTSMCVARGNRLDELQGNWTQTFGYIYDDVLTPEQRSEVDEWLQERRREEQAETR